MSREIFNDEVKNLLLNGTPIERRYACKISPLCFAVYYFSDVFDQNEGAYPLADFHFDYYQDYKDFIDGKIDQLMWTAFAEAAKTLTWKICVTHAICYGYFKYINWDSYDKGNAEQALFDIKTWLQTNSKIVEDFGLFFSKRSALEPSRQKITDFITSTGIRVEAHSTQEPIRGRLYKKQRPDLYILDDIENSKTIRSRAITTQVIEHTNEVIRSVDQKKGKTAFLTNFISESGSVAHVMARLQQNPRARVRFTPVETDDGVLTWPEKYVKFDIEVDQNAKVPKISLETKKREIENYDGEMLLKPTASSDILFDRDLVNKALLLCEKPIETIAEQRIYRKYKSHHRYGLGADVAEGQGGDSSTTAIIDFSSGELVATYNNNEISPDIFAHEIKAHGQRYGSCLVAPERNNIGYTTIVELKKIYDNIYTEVKVLNRTDQPTDRLGWQTTKYSKPEMFYQLKKAFEDGELKIYDKAVLEEMKYYSRNELTDTSAGIITRHYDLLTAVAIAWAMKNHAFVMEDDEEEVFIEESPQ